MGSKPGPEYPDNWERKHALPCKEAAGWRCECCGVVDGSLGTTQNGKRKGRDHIIYLTAAHLDRNDKANPDPRLAALCPTCHGLFDHGTPAQQQMVYEAILETRRTRKGK